MNQYIIKQAKEKKLTVGVAIKELGGSSPLDRIYDSDIFVSINKDEPFSGASLMKVPLMACCFLADREQKLNLEDTYVLKESDKTPGSGVLKYRKAGEEFTLLGLIEYMISESDNTASNILIGKLGFDYINDCSKRLGLENTEFQRFIMDLKSRKKGIDNLISAGDLAYLYEKIYKEELVDKEASLKMLKFLSNQKVKDRIPRYLPKDIKIAHKTGTIRGIIHDAGIIFTDKVDYILCVLTGGKTGYGPAKAFIAKVSEFVYHLIFYGN